MAREVKETANCFSTAWERRALQSALHAVSRGETARSQGSPGRVDQEENYRPILRCHAAQNASNRCGWLADSGQSALTVAECSSLADGAARYLPEDGVSDVYGDWFPVPATRGRLLGRYRYVEQVEPYLSLNVNFLVLNLPEPEGRGAGFSSTSRRPPPRFQRTVPYPAAVHPLIPPPTLITSLPRAARIPLAWALRLPLRQMT